MDALSGHWYDPTSAYAGTVLGVAGLLLGIFVWWVSRPKGAIDCMVVSSMRFVTLKPQQRIADLTISYAGQAISEPRLTRIRLVNTGRTGVSKDAFDNSGPIELSIRGHSIRGANVERVGARAVMTIGNLPIASGTAQITPKMLNARSWIEIVVLSDQRLRPRVQVVGTFDGQTRPMRVVVPTDIVMFNLLQRRAAWYCLSAVVLLVLLVGYLLPAPLLLVFPWTMIALMSLFIIPAVYVDVRWVVLRLRRLVPSKGEWN